MEGHSPNGASPEAVIPQVHEALRVVHDPYSANNTRQEAQAFLEQVKQSSDAPLIGYKLAIDSAQSPIVRHYALSLLSFTITQKWEDFNDQQRTTVREWVLQLCQAVSKDDPIYLRNKVPQLWTEMAKRDWSDRWPDMDASLLKLWQNSDLPVHKEVVLFVLESLSDEIFNSTDYMVMLRDSVLSKSCVEIFTSASVLAEAFPNRTTSSPSIRAGEEGWLVRVNSFLGQCLGADVQNNEDARSCAVKSLNVLASLMSWAVPLAVKNANIVSVVCQALAASHVSVQKAALNCLYVLYTRVTFSDEDLLSLVAPMFEPEIVSLCQRLSEWSKVDANDIDIDKYQFAKKFSEMLSHLANYLVSKLSIFPPTADIPGFLNLLLQVVQSESLVVSIPVLVSWTKLLTHRTIGPDAANNDQVLGILLQVCSSRQVRYEHFHEDSEDPSYLFLMEDTENLPERHAFLGNYRRFSAQVIEAIVRLKLSESFEYLLGQVDEVIQHLYDSEPRHSVTNYSKYSMPVLKIDTNFAVVEIALKSYAKRRASEGGIPPDTRAMLETYLEKWGRSLLAINFEDPQIRKRALQLLVALSTTALDSNSPFMLSVLEHILMYWPTLQPENKAYNEAIKDLQNESMVELQRLAAKVPDHLIQVYDQIASRVNELLNSGTLDDKRAVAYRSFLFLIIHRATKLPIDQRMSKLISFVAPTFEQWKSPQLLEAISTYQGFCQMLGLDKAQQYLASHRVNEVSEWGECKLDEEGLRIQAELEERQQMLPLRATKAFLAISVEKVTKPSVAFSYSIAIWKDNFQSILSALLQFLGHAHASHNPSNWHGLPENIRPAVVSKVLSDRFWQSGISEGSKDDFYNRVLDKKDTLEGLGSTIRGSIRFVRETAYAVIYCLSRMDELFYTLPELPNPLAHALFSDSLFISSHQQISLLNLVRYLVDDCPVENRENFLPPVLEACFRQMDTKINSEWEALASQQTVQTGGDELTEEMKAESILRQVTYTAVVMVADFLDPNKKNPALKSDPSSSSALLDNEPKYPTLRRFCLSRQGIVEPLLVFSTHAIRMKDSRCCGYILRVLRTIASDLRAQPIGGSSDGRLNDHMAAFPIPPETVTAIREFMSTETLQACITSFHEPYFVDTQKDLSYLMAAIYVYFVPVTNTPVKILLSLPGITTDKLQAMNEFLANPDNTPRLQRAAMFDLLKHLKGVSIAEMGKLDAPAKKKETRSKMAQEFMQAPNQNGGPNIPRTASPDGLDGVSNLFES
ncbi:nuclear import and export protein [Ceratocystis lukuohia]|uniref:Nuclear import and export protein n=1 Tax=Ceratocystis lukuohia TaxID=2019550 RepID=A0ABR4MLJ5_9PEZI